MQRTPFYQFHVDHGAKMVDFAGWEMPLHYGSILEEHHAVRNSGGLFDVSHMGRVKFSGRHARRFLERVCTRQVSAMREMTCRYSFVCNERGGVKDDVIIYRLEDHWMMVCNAANRQKLMAHFEAVRGDLALHIEDLTPQTAMVAVQGPSVMNQIEEFSSEVPALKRYSFCEKDMVVVKLVISRTGYTGEDGVEAILGAKSADMAMKMLLREDDGDRIRPAGLGCRDTLRLEAGMPLYGQELSEEIDPLSAGLGFAVSLEKDQETRFGEPEPFIGQEALKQMAATSLPRKLVGLKLDGRRTPRQHMVVRAGDRSVGEVTSGCLSPTLGHPIAMAYVDSECAEEGNSLNIDFGRAGVDAEVVKLPFYKRG